MNAKDEGQGTVETARWRLAEFNVAILKGVTSGTGDLRGMLQACAEAMVEHLRAALARIWILEESSDTLVLTASAGLYTRLDGKYGRIGLGEKRIGRIASGRQSWWTNDLMHDPEVLDPSWVAREGLVSSAGHPVTLGPRILGVVAIYSRSALDEFERAALRVAADTIGLGVVRHESEVERFRLVQILEASTDFVGTATPEGRVLHMNRAGRVMAGIPVDENVRGMPITDLHPPWAVTRILVEGLPAALERGSWQGETAVRSRDGREVPVSQLIQACTDEAGHVQYISTVMRDITDRKEAEMTLLEQSIELSAANAELERAARMKDEFLANMSHELRTPLNAVLGLSEALRDGVYGNLTQGQESALRTIHESGTHLLELITDILDLSKMEAGKLELDRGPLDLGDVVRSSIGFVRQVAQKKRLRLVVELPEGLCMVSGDGRRLKQVMVNLLSNAVKFTSEEGTVGVRVERDDERRAVRLIVHDTGIGIAREDQARLFRPFVQLDAGLNRKYEGTGLGLSLVARMVEMHGGSVSVESELGKGARFIVLLPALSLDEVHALIEESRGGADSRRRLEAGRRDAEEEGPQARRDIRVLLVEDNDLNVFMMQKYLEARGYEVEVASDGIEGVRRAREGRPDVILMDVQMPRMDGYTATRLIRQETGNRRIPIVALTALATADDRRRSLEAGADRYLSKPVPLTSLEQTIQDLVREARGQ